MSGKVHVTIGGQPVSVLPGSINVGSTVDGRPSARLTVKQEGDPAVVYRPFHRGEPVEVHQTFDEAEPAELLFRGFVDTPSETSPARGFWLHALQLVDNHYLADKRTVARGYVDQTAGAVVADLHALVLAAEGVTIGEIADGPTIPDVRFNYVSVSAALDALAEYAGFWWRIDAEYRLWFLPRTGRAAPFTVTGRDGTALDGTVQVSGDARHYRNTQYIRGGRDKTDEQVERFRGDGDTQTFNVGFPIADQPTITVNGAAQTVGVRGIDDAANRDWYFSFASTEISQRNGATPLTASQVLQVTYRGLLSVVTVSRDQDAIDALQAVEQAGSGIVEHVHDEPEINDRTVAFDLAAAKLARWTKTGRTLRFDTRRPGLEAGQLLTVDMARHGLATDMLITDVTLVWDGAARWQVTAIEGPDRGSWTRFFGDLYRRPVSMSVLENITLDEVLVVLKGPYTRVWQAADRPNIFLEPLPDGSWLADGSVTPAFRRGERITHFEVTHRTSGARLLRKPITKSTGMTTGEIATVAYLSPSDGVDGGVGDVVWFGGFRAGLAGGSGVEVARVTVGEEKTTAEAWQIERTDTKGF